MFKEKEHISIYNSYIEIYLSHILSIEDMREELEQLPIFYNALTMWKKNPLFSAAMTLKKIAFVIEEKLPNYNDNLDCSIFMNDFVIQYLKARAMQQAYYMQNKIKKVTLYRGMDKKEIRTENIGMDTSLVGYTHNLFIGTVYGRFGKTIKAEVPIEDIVIDLDKILHDAWPTGEEEVIILGIKRKVIIINGQYNAT